MNSRLRRLLLRYFAALAVIAILVLIMRGTRFVAFSVTTASFVAGGFAVLCLVGVGFGIWDARRMENRRKTKEDIWINH